MYEVELTNPANLMVLGQKANRSNLEQEVKKHTIKLLLFEDEKTQKILYASYMSLEKHSTGEFEKLHYKNLGNFTGTVLYYHFTGQLANGWNYTNGRIAEKITVITKKQFDQLQIQTQGDIRTEGMVCQSGFADKYQWTCVGVPGYENCGFTYVGQEYVTYCNYEEEDKDYLGNENESGGGYDTPLTPDCAGVRGGDAYTDPNCNTCIGGTTGIESCADIKHKLDSFPCAKNLVNQMPNLKSDIASKINSLFNKNDNIDLVFQANPLLKNTSTDGNYLGYAGSTNGTAGTYRVGMNPDVLANASKEYILVTLYHEALHAYLDHKKRTLTTLEFNTQFAGYTVNGGRLLMSQDPQHWPMAYANFVNGLRDVILEFNSSYDFARATALAKGGIITLSNTESDINKQERNTNDPVNNPGYTGTKCP